MPMHHHPDRGPAQSGCGLHRRGQFHPGRAGGGRRAHGRDKLLSLCTGWSLSVPPGRTRPVDLAADVPRQTDEIEDL